MSFIELLKTHQANKPKDTDTFEPTLVALTPSKDQVDVQIKSPQAVDNMEEILAQHGFSPEKYMVKDGSLKVKSWDAQKRVLQDNGKYETVTHRMWSYSLTVLERAEEVNVDDLVETIKSQSYPHRVPNDVPWEPGTFFLGMGDLQGGKMDSDGIDGQVNRFKEMCNEGAERAWFNGSTKAVIAFLGDMCEGFVSQGGRNSWRTTLTLTEQLRVMRRLYLYAIDTFIDNGIYDLTVVAVPGNHGDTMRSPVTTRQDDNYDTDSLVAVADALELNPGRYGDVKCYVPGKDEFSVALEVEGCRVGFAHGHQFRPGKQWEWWRGQRFGQTPIGLTDVLIVGHGHHTHIEERDTKTFIMVPALEELSVWFQTATGVSGSPGAIVGVFREGRMVDITKINADYRGEGSWHSRERK